MNEETVAREVPDEAAVRLAPNVFRHVNDRIWEVASRWGAQQMREFVCECDSYDCSRAVRMTVAEYGAVRAQPDHYVVAPDHELAPPGRLVASNARYLVVERAAEPAPVA